MQVRRCRTPLKSSGHKACTAYWDAAETCFRHSSFFPAALLETLLTLPGPAFLRRSLSFTNSIYLQYLRTASSRSRQFRAAPIQVCCCRTSLARSDNIIVLWRFHNSSSCLFCGQHLLDIGPDAVSTPLCALTEVHYRRRKHRPPVVSSQTWLIPHGQDELSFDAEESGKVQRIGGTPIVDHPCSVC